MQIEIVHTYGHVYTRDSSLNWFSSSHKTCWNLIGRSIIAPQPVLSPSSIFLSSSSHCVYVHTAGRDEKIAQLRRATRFRDRLQISMNVESFCYALFFFYCTVVLSSNPCFIGILELPLTLLAVKYRSLYTRI